jgi:uncharacterized membrane protein SpoIIM required for sporulation
VDLDSYVAAHSAEWARLESLLGRASSPRKLSGAQVDELVDLYQRTATHLSVVQSAGRDELLVGRLSSLVARARGVVAGGRRASRSDVARFLRVDFAAICYRTRWWWIGATAFFLVVAVGVGGFVATSPEAQLAVAPPEVVQQLVQEDFENYYSSAPAQDFAAQVFTNNAYVAAQAIVFGILLGVPVLYVLAANALNVGVAGGLMAANDRSGLFFGLILPHGLLELTAVFVGLALVLFVSGIIEAFVTPSPLPTWARIGIGVLAEIAFLAYVFGPGRRAVRAGITGDVTGDLRGDVRPAAA